MSKIFTALLILVLSVSVWGCKDDATSVPIPPQIEGYVYDDVTLEPVPNATVSTIPPSVTILTDTVGKFLIKNLAEGTYEVDVQATGYYAKSIQVEVEKGEKTRAIIKIHSYKSDNKAPTAPIISSTVEDENDSLVTAVLSWTASDPDDHALVYDVYWGNSESSMTPILTGTAQLTTRVEHLVSGNKYYWKVVARDIYDASASSTVTLFQGFSSLYYGLIARYYFDGNTDDSGPNGLNGIGENISYTEGHDGKANGAVYFDVKNAIINVAYDPKLDLGSNFTISFWLKPKSGYGSVVPGCNTVDVIGRWFGEQKLVSEFVCAISTTGSFGFYTGVGSSLEYYFPNINISSNYWKNVTVVFKNNKADFYENGVYLTSSSISAPNASTLPLRIGGNRAPNTDNNFSTYFGAIDNLYIYNRSLTSSEVLKIVQK